MERKRIWSQNESNSFFGFWVEKYDDGGIQIVANDEYGCSLTPQEAVEFATKIINHSFPHTRPKRTFKELDTLEARKEYVSPVKIRDPGPYLNQGCHRPGGHIQSGAWK